MARTARAPARDAGTSWAPRFFPAVGARGRRPIRAGGVRPHTPKWPALLGRRPATLARRGARVLPCRSAPGPASFPSHSNVRLRFGPTTSVCSKVRPPISTMLSIRFALAGHGSSAQFDTDRGARPRHALARVVQCERRPGDRHRLAKRLILAVDDRAALQTGFGYCLHIGNVRADAWVRGRIASRRDRVARQRIWPVVVPRES